MAEKRRYSEDDKATALALLQANGGNLKRTARELQIPLATLRDWNKGEGVSPGVAEKQPQKKEELASLFDKVARAYLAHALNPEAVGASSGKDAVITAATATDKIQLLSGKPTGITGYSFDHLSDAELDAELARAERDAPGAPPGEGATRRAEAQGGAKAAG